MSSKYRRALKGSRATVSKKKYYRQPRRKAQSRKYFIKKKSKRIKNCLLVLLAVLILGLIAYFLFFSSYSKIKQIQVNKSVNYNLISEQEIKQKITFLIEKKRLFFPQENLLVFKKQNLKRILEKESRVAEFTIYKNWPNKLMINLKESEPVASLISFGNYQNYYLNKKGEVIYLPQQLETSQDFATLEQEQEIKGELKEGKQEKSDLPVFYDKTEVNLKDLNYITFLKNILDFINHEILKSHQIKVNLITITEDKGIFKAKTQTNQGWFLIINSESDFDKQINNLALVLDKKLNSEQNLEHIDLRFGEKIFYKLKDNQKQQEY